MEILKTRTSSIDLQCRLIRIALFCYVATEVVFFVLAWIVPSPITIGTFSMELTPKGMTMEQLHAMLPAQHLLGTLLGLPALLLLGYALWQLDGMLRGFQKNAMFAENTIRHLHAFAGAGFLSITLSIFEVPLRILLDPVVMGTPMNRMSFGMTSDELFALLLCGLFYLIAGMMHEGRRLKQEVEEFV